eukprot:scaffold3939_cov166-Amphora_coffeaeformis.AAC.17
MDDFVEIEKAHYTFPERLMELLEGETVKEAMWWLPGGSAFAIRPKVFYDIVLSKHFQGTKFESFTRKLNRWGFRRLASQGIPQSTIAYYNKSFKQGQPDLVKNMRSGSKGGKFSELDKSLNKDSPAGPTAVASIGHSGASVEAHGSLQEYWKNQSIITARQAQHGLLQAAPQVDSFIPSSAQGLSSMPLDLVAMQRRARLQAVQQMAAYQNPSAIRDIREALFSRVGMGILDSAPVPPALVPQNDVLNPQLVQLLLLRERLGQSGRSGINM